MTQPYKSQFRESNGLGKEKEGDLTQPQGNELGFHSNPTQLSSLEL